MLGVAVVRAAGAVVNTRTRAEANLRIRGAGLRSHSDEETEEKRSC